MIRSAIRERGSVPHSVGLLARLICLCASVISVTPLASRAEVRQLRVAAAADLQWAMNDLARQYESQTGTRVSVSYGSSGNFFSQIQNGAPFDLFLSADVGYPRRLEGAGLAEPASLFIYAQGQIVLWAPPSEKINIAKQQWAALANDNVQKIAIANPAHAPYGRAAVAALQKAGIYPQVRDKLVYGENIAQAAQFVQSGNAQVGILAKSLALSPALRAGQLWEIPEGLYPPIEQAAIVLKHAANKDAADAFLRFLKSDAGRNILVRNGFVIPGAQLSGH